MATGARLCDICIAEDFRPRRLRPADHLEEWDGVSYPALRSTRPADVPRERYETFLRVVLGPVVRGETTNPSEAA